MQLNMNVIIFQGVLLTVQGLSYLLVQHTRRPIHDMARQIDESIPVVPQFIFAYVMWYPLIAVFPLTLYAFDSMLHKAYIVSIIADIIISLLVYWFYPTSFRRPELAGRGLSTRLLKTMYVADYKGLNCMPSMHCSMCFIIMWYTVICNGMYAWMRILFGAISALIVVSTVFTKQHVLIDVAAALLLAALCVAITILF